MLRVLTTIKNNWLNTSFQALYGILLKLKPERHASICQEEKQETDDLDRGIGLGKGLVAGQVVAAKQPAAQQIRNTDCKLCVQ